MADSFIQVPPDSTGKQVDAASLVVNAITVQRQRVELAIGTSSTTAPTNATSTAYETNRVVKASAGALFGATIHNSRTSSQFLHLYDAAALPAEGAAPTVVINVPASTTISIDFGTFGRRFAIGIVIANSSTGPTKTIGSADLWIDAQYN